MVVDMFLGNKVAVAHRTLVLGFPMGEHVTVEQVLPVELLGADRACVFLRLAIVRVQAALSLERLFTDFPFIRVCVHLVVVAEVLGTVA